MMTLIRCVSLLVCLSLLLSACSPDKSNLTRAPKQQKKTDQRKTDSTANQEESWAYEENGQSLYECDQSPVHDEGPKLEEPQNDPTHTTLPSPLSAPPPTFLSFSNSSQSFLGVTPDIGETLFSFNHPSSKFCSPFQEKCFQFLYPVAGVPSSKFYESFCSDSQIACLKSLVMINFI